MALELITSATGRSHALNIDGRIVGYAEVTTAGRLVLRLDGRQSEIVGRDSLLRNIARLEELVRRRLAA